MAVAYKENDIVLIRTATHKTAKEPQLVLATKLLLPKKVLAKQLHRIIGHLGYRNLRKLIKNTTGVKLDSYRYATCTCY